MTCGTGFTYRARRCYESDFQTYASEAECAEEFGGGDTETLKCNTEECPGIIIVKFFSKKDICLNRRACQEAAAR